MAKYIQKETQQNELIVQHNHLIEARYHLTLQEKRLMCWLASQVKPTDEDFKEHELSIKEFASFLDVKGDHLYKTLDAITHKLMQKIITIKEIEKKGFTKAALLGGVKYYDGQGIIKLSFHPYLKPYMLQLKESFTKINLGDILGLKSIHSIRIYELLKQYELIGQREILLQELRECCGIDETKYKNFNDFKRFVLNKSSKEINNKTDVYINYDEIKKSRKITSIKFYIKKNIEKKIVNIVGKEYRSDLALVDALVEYGFSKPTSKKLLQNGTEEVVRNAMKVVDLQIAKGHVKNAKAMLRVAIQEQWHPEKFKQTKKKAA